ncbi:succinate dehydrogenase/fumarate reductase cytochrome b subunit [Methanomicrobium sp. W14]|uniref:hypothetical protein n=1 Tax=Methanomicrobium sp. W14 TaxID=2817839 RepID=UPI001AE801F4|nr:hypothetical protein [Methanomicrobium sp. W14]MBP2133395.1 succinate dehydrogenase/fumarate reductase cytochrome b subunit [Methanomicrobium sp. W14]
MAGITTLSFLIATFLIVMLNRRGYHKIPMKWHFRLGKFTVLLALFHGLLGVILFL